MRAALRRASDEHGVALVTVIVLSAALLVFCTGFYLVATRESKMAFAGQSGGQAFSYAEGGLENTLDILNYAATEWQLTQPRDDQSTDATGYHKGYLMDPDPALRQTPSDPVVMRIGDSNFTVWVDEITAQGVHCTGCGFDMSSPSYQTAYLLVTAESQTTEGYRKLQVPVKIESSGYPMAFYVNGNLELEQTPSITNESIYVSGNVYGRNDLAVSGNDLAYGTNGGAANGAAAVFATGVINGQENNNTAIYTATGARSSYWAANDINDRDNRGPTGNTFNSTKLGNILNNYGILPGLAPGPTMTLKTQAYLNGYYNINPPTRDLVISQANLPNRGGDLVVYVEFPSGDPNRNTVTLDFQWPPNGYNTGKVMVVIRNGSVKLSGTAMTNSYGTIYCPDGELEAESGTGKFTGFVWAKGAEIEGNFTFGLDTRFMQDPPFFVWTITRMNDWVEVDRPLA